MIINYWEFLNCVSYRFNAIGMIQVFKKLVGKTTLHNSLLIQQCNIKIKMSIGTTTTDSAMQIKSIICTSLL